MIRKILTFGIDFDDTITADANLFAMLIKIIRETAMHNVVVVTGRSDIGHWSSEVREFLKQLEEDYDLQEIPIVFAGSQWKREAATEAGYTIDIWIDNQPEYVGKQYLLKNVQAGVSHAMLSPETNGRIKRNMEKALETNSSWDEFSEELRSVYPKRAKTAEEKNAVWQDIDAEAQDMGLLPNGCMRCTN